MRLEHAYQEKTSSVSYDGGVAKDDRSMYGADFAIERAVWKDGCFGVDVSAGFAFFICNNWFKSSQGGWTRTDTTVDGKYLTDVQFNPDVVGDPWSQNPDGSYGAGSFDSDVGNLPDYQALPVHIRCTGILFRVEIHPLPADWLCVFGAGRIYGHLLHGA